MIKILMGLSTIYTIWTTYTFLKAWSSRDWYRKYTKKAMSKMKWYAKIYYIWGIYWLMGGYVIYRKIKDMVK